MDEEAPMRGIRRGFRRRFWITLAASPLVLVSLGWIALASPLGRGWIAGKIRNHTGMETRIGGVSATPWDGIRLRQVVLLQPPSLRDSVSEPFARIHGVHLAPVWRSWLRGRRELQSIELDTPRFVVSLEWLASLAPTQSPAPPAASTAPAVAAATPPPAPTSPKGTTIPAPPAATPQAPPSPVHSVPTAWLHVKNASLTLISARSGSKPIEISELTGSIPVAGGPAESTLRVGSIHAARHPVGSHWVMELHWRSPMLSIEPFEASIFDLQVKAAAKLGMLNGLPLQFQIQVPQQSPAPVTLPNHGQATAASVAANAGFRGLLLAPGTWQGQFLAEAIRPSATFGEQSATFDRGSTVTVLRGGRLSCIDARLIGDELSFLGNATLLADGRTAAALRVVAPPDSIASIFKRVFPDAPQAPSLTPLSTPQRAALDLEAFGTIHRLFLRLGREGSIIPLNP